MQARDVTVLERRPGSIARPDKVAADLLGPAGLGPGAHFDGWDITAWAHEGDHARIEMRHAAGLVERTILVRPHDAAFSAFLRTERWNVSYRGDGFDGDLARALQAIGDRLERVALDLGFDAADLQRRYYERPTKDEVLEVSPGRKLYVRVTEHCDEACLFCNATEGVSNVMPARSGVADVLRGMPVGSLAQIIFSGGEPTLVKGLPELVGLAYDRGARDIILQTNGVALAAPGALEAYLPYRDRLGIGFSLHAMEPGLSAAMIDHADIDRFPAKLRAIDKAIALGFRVKVTCVVMRPNLAQVPAFAQWCWDRWGLGLHRLQFSYAMPRGNAWLNQHLIARFSECTVAFAAAFELGRRTGLRIETSQSACIPPCVMPDYVDHYDLYGDYSGGKVTDPERVKPPDVCGGCKWDRICTGVWQRYLDVFGAGELHAITDRPDPGTVIDDYHEAEVLALDSCG